MIRPGLRRNAGLWGLAIAVLFQMGCVGYRLGSMLPSDIRTVYVYPVMNQTDEPLIETEVTRAVIQEIQKDGSLRVVREPSEADAHLRSILTGYALSPLAYSDARRTTTEEYRLLLTASVVLTRRGSNAIVVEVPQVSGESTFLLTGDLTSSKRTGLPDAAADLGRRMVSSLVEAWP